MYVRTAESVESVSTQRFAAIFSDSYLKSPICMDICSIHLLQVFSIAALRELVENSTPHTEAHVCAERISHRSIVGCLPFRLIVRHLCTQSSANLQQCMLHKWHSGWWWWWCWCGATQQLLR